MLTLLLLLPLQCCVAPAANLAANDTLTTHEVAPGVVLELISAPLDPSAHRVVRDSSGHIAAIDGCLVQGGAGETPAYALREAAVVLDGQRLELDPSCLYQDAPFEASSVVGRATGDGSYELEGRFGSGHGLYEVTWRVTTAGSLRTRLAPHPQLDEEFTARAECHRQWQRRVAAADRLDRWLSDVRDALTDWRGSPVPASSVGTALEVLEEARPPSSPPCP